MWIRENVAEACRRFQGSISSLQLIGGTYEHVYSFTHSEKIHILKLYPIAAKDPQLIQIELEWMNYLRKNGINIPQPITSVNGNFVEIIAMLPLPFCAVSFEQIKGERLDMNQHSTWQDRFYRHFGQMMGKIHRLSQQFTATESILDEWNEGEIYHRDFSSVQTGIFKKWEQFISEIKNFPQQQETYGLILNDVHIGNCLLTDNSHFALYDLTKIKRHWYTYDIAISLQDLRERLIPNETEDVFTRFLLSFIEGYRQENRLDDDQYEQIQFFMDFRKLFRHISHWV